MRPLPSVPILVATALAFTLTGCGARDTEIDSIPGPGARTSVPAPPPVEIRQNQTDIPGVTAGVNSAGQPSSSAGGHIGPATIGETKAGENAPTTSSSPR